MHCLRAVLARLVSPCSTLHLYSYRPPTKETAPQPATVKPMCEGDLWRGRFVPNGPTP